MSKNTKVAIGALVILAVLFIGYQSVQKSGPLSDTGDIVIGVLQPLTGDAASYGESELHAIQVAVDEINKAGGVLNRKITIVPEDGKCDPQAGGTAAQKLVNINTVKIIIGGACSGETLAAAAITEPAKVILLSPSASSPKVTAAGDFVFRTYPSDALAGKVNAAYAIKKLGYRKAALITELTDYAQGLREVYKKTFTEMGGTIVADETYTTGTTDFRTQVLKIKTAKPDVVYVVVQSPTPGISIFRQLREGGVKAGYTTAEVLLDRQIVKDNAAVLEGVIGVEVAVDYDGNPKAKAFRDAHRAMFQGKDPGSFGANAYDAVYLVKDAIIASGGVDTVKIRDWLYGVKNWQGAVGSLTMDGNGDPLLGLSVRKILNGVVTNLASFGA